MKRLLAVVMLTAIIVVGAVAAAQAANPNLGVIPPNAKAEAVIYEQLAQQWDTWAFSYPSALNPWGGITNDPFGFAPDYGQKGSVWFLAGNFRDGTYERSVTVPANKALFFPLVNTVYLGFKSDPPMSSADVDKILADQWAFMDGQSVSCEVDGQSVASSETHTFQTPKEKPFTINLPKDNLFGFSKAELPMSPCWQVGTYLLLAPLPAGSHTIHFAVPSFPLDVTYNLTVTSRK